jgi:hypothetical protein
LQWKYNVAIPVKTDPFVSLVSSEEVATKDNKLAHLYARVKLRVTDPHALISSFGQNWFPDWAEPLMEETLAYYAGEHDEAFFKAMTGPPVSSLKLVEKMQAAFEDRSMPLEVIYAAPEYLPSSKDPRFVLSADSKKWVLSPRYSH